PQLARGLLIFSIMMSAMGRLLLCFSVMLAGTATTWGEAAEEDPPTQLAAGFDHTCARTMRGRDRCWGSNASGQIGDGSFLDREAPTMVNKLTDVVQVAAAGNRSCGVRVDGSVWCWGDIKLSAVPEPERVPVPVAAVQVTLGNQHGCARAGDG